LLYRKLTIPLHPHLQYFLGLYGFDGKTKWYVSMRSIDDWLLNLGYRTINWRK